MPAELRDLDLVARVLATDDRHAFAELVKRHQSTVRGFLRRMTRGQHAVADDLAQETFIEAYRHLAKYRGSAQFSTWLLGIACNRFRRDCRRKKPAEPWNESAAIMADATDPSLAGTAPDHTVALQSDVGGALARLSDEERAAIHLCYNSGLSHEEAANALACPLGTLKSHVARAKLKLRTFLRDWAPT